MEFEPRRSYLFLQQIKTPNFGCDLEPQTVKRQDMQNAYLHLVKNTSGC